MNKKTKKFSLDPALEKYYAEGNEQERLATHRLERDRTLWILEKHLPPPPARILDIGGAAGAYAFPLAQKGYEVYLIDPILQHIEQAKAYAQKSGFHLAHATVGDARHLELGDQSIDVVLMLGPLYHLTDQKDRQKALQEAYRVLKSGGVLFAAGISRFASFIDAIHKNAIQVKYKGIEHELQTGVHRKVVEDFTFAYLHHPSELRKEVKEAGFQEIALKAIEGPVWDKRSLEAIYPNEEDWQKLLVLLEQIETEEAILGASAHLMAIARKP